MKIDKKLIKELTNYLNEFQLTEIEYADKNLKIKVSRSSSQNIKKVSEIGNYSSKKEVSQSTTDGLKVNSPIIGTAYLAPEPGAKPFVSVGKKVKKGDTIMIVEAMKTMNHVPSTENGTIKEICVEDGEPVEFGQALVIIN